MSNVQAFDLVVLTLLSRSTWGQIEYPIHTPEIVDGSGTDGAFMAAKIFSLGQKLDRVGSWDD